MYGQHQHSQSQQQVGNLGFQPGQTNLGAPNNLQHGGQGGIGWLGFDGAAGGQAQTAMAPQMPSYVPQATGYYPPQQPMSYGGQQQQQPPMSYSGQQQQPPMPYGGQQQQPMSYGGHHQQPSGYAGQQQQPSGYAGQQQQPTGYAGQQQQPSYVAQPTGYVPQPTGYMPQQATNYMPQQAPYQPQHTGYQQQYVGYQQQQQQPASYQPQPTGYVPQRTGYTPQPSGHMQPPGIYVPQSTGYVPQPTGYMPQQAAGFPQQPQAFGAPQQPQAYGAPQQQYAPQQQAPSYTPQYTGYMPQPAVQQMPQPGAYPAPYTGMQTQPAAYASGASLSGQQGYMQHQGQSYGAPNQPMGMQPGQSYGAPSQPMGPGPGYAPVGVAGQPQVAPAEFKQNLSQAGAGDAFAGLPSVAARATPQGSGPDLQTGAHAQGSGAGMQAAGQTGAPATGTSGGWISFDQDTSAAAASSSGGMAQHAEHGTHATGVTAGSQPAPAASFPARFESPAPPWGGSGNAATAPASLQAPSTVPAQVGPGSFQAPTPVPGFATAHSGPGNLPAAAQMGLTSALPSAQFGPPATPGSLQAGSFSSAHAQNMTGSFMAAATSFAAAPGGFTAAAPSAQPPSNAPVSMPSHGINASSQSVASSAFPTRFDDDAAPFPHQRGASATGQAAPGTAGAHNAAFNTGVAPASTGMQAMHSGHASGITSVPTTPVHGSTMSPISAQQAAGSVGGSAFPVSFADEQPAPGAPAPGASSYASPPLSGYPSSTTTLHMQSSIQHPQAALSGMGSGPPASQGAQSFSAGQAYGYPNQGAPSAGSFYGAQPSMLPGVQQSSGLSAPQVQSMPSGASHQGQLGVHPDAHLGVAAPAAAPVEEHKPFKSVPPAPLPEDLFSSPAVETDQAYKPQTQPSSAPAPLLSAGAAPSGAASMPVMPLPAVMTSAVPAAFSLLSRTQPALTEPKNSGNPFADDSTSIAPAPAPSVTVAGLGTSAAAPLAAATGFAVNFDDDNVTQPAGTATAAAAAQLTPADNAAPAFAVQFNDEALPQGAAATELSMARPAAAGAAAAAAAATAATFAVQFDDDDNGREALPHAAVQPPAAAAPAFAVQFTDDDASTTIAASPEYVAPLHNSVAAPTADAFAAPAMPQPPAAAAAAAAAAAVTPAPPAPAAAAAATAGATSVSAWAAFGDDHAADDSATTGFIAAEKVVTSDMQQASSATTLAAIETSTIVQAVTAVPAAETTVPQAGAVLPSAGAVNGEGRFSTNGAAALPEDLFSAPTTDPPAALIAMNTSAAIAINTSAAPEPAAALIAPAAGVDATREAVLQQSAMPHVPAAAPIAPITAPTAALTSRTAALPAATAAAVVAPGLSTHDTPGTHAVLASNADATAMHTTAAAVVVDTTDSASLAAGIMGPAVAQVHASAVATSTNEAAAVAPVGGSTWATFDDDAADSAFSVVGVPAQGTMPGAAVEDIPVIPPLPVIPESAVTAAGLPDVVSPRATPRTTATGYDTDASSDTDRPSNFTLGGATAIAGNPFAAILTPELMAAASAAAAARTGGASQSGSVMQLGPSLPAAGTDGATAGTTTMNVAGVQVDSAAGAVGAATGRGTVEAAGVQAADATPTAGILSAVVPAATAETINTTTAVMPMATGSGYGLASVMEGDATTTTLQAPAAVPATEATATAAGLIPERLVMQVANLASVPAQGTELQDNVAPTSGWVDFATDSASPLQPMPAVGFAEFTPAAGSVEPASVAGIGKSAPAIGFGEPISVADVPSTFPVAPTTGQAPPADVPHMTPGDHAAPAAPNTVAPTDASAEQHFGSQHERTAALLEHSKPPTTEGISKATAAAVADVQVFAKAAADASADAAVAAAAAAAEATGSDAPVTAVALATVTAAADGTETTVNAAAAMDGASAALATHATAATPAAEGPFSAVQAAHALFATRTSTDMAATIIPADGSARPGSPVGVPLQQRSTSYSGTGLTPRRSNGSRGSGGRGLSSTASGGQSLSRPDTPPLDTLQVSIAAAEALHAVQHVAAGRGPGLRSLDGGMMTDRSSPPPVAAPIAPSNSIGSQMQSAGSQRSIGRTSASNMPGSFSQSLRSWQRDDIPQRGGTHRSSLELGIAAAEATALAMRISSSRSSLDPRAANAGTWSVLPDTGTGATTQPAQPLDSTAQATPQFAALLSQGTATDEIPAVSMTSLTSTAHGEHETAQRTSTGNAAAEPTQPAVIEPIQSGLPQSMPFENTTGGSQLSQEHIMASSLFQPGPSQTLSMPPNSAAPMTSPIERMPVPAETAATIAAEGQVLGGEAAAITEGQALQAATASTQGATGAVDDAVHHIPQGQLHQDVALAAAAQGPAADWVSFGADDAAPFPEPVASIPEAAAVQASAPAAVEQPHVVAAQAAQFSSTGPTSLASRFGGSGFVESTFAGDSAAFGQGSAAFGGDSAAFHQGSAASGDGSAVFGQDSAAFAGGSAAFAGDSAPPWEIPDVAHVVEQAAALTDHGQHMPAALENREDADKSVLEQEAGHGTDHEAVREAESMAGHGAGHGDQEWVMVEHEGDAPVAVPAEQANAVAAPLTVADQSEDTSGDASYGQPAGTDLGPATASNINKHGAGNEYPHGLQPPHDDGSFPAALTAPAATEEQAAGWTSFNDDALPFAVPGAAVTTPAALPVPEYPSTATAVNPFEDEAAFLPPTSPAQLSASSAAVNPFGDTTSAHVSASHAAVNPFEEDAAAFPTASSRSVSQGGTHGRGAGASSVASVVASTIALAQQEGHADTVPDSGGPTKPYETIPTALPSSIPVGAVAAMPSSMQRAADEVATPAAGWMSFADETDVLPAAQAPAVQASVAKVPSQLTTPPAPQAASTNALTVPGLATAAAAAAEAAGMTPRGSSSGAVGSPNTRPGSSPGVDGPERTSPISTSKTLRRPPPVPPRPMGLVRDAATARSFRAASSSGATSPVAMLHGSPDASPMVDTGNTQPISSPRGVAVQSTHAGHITSPPPSYESVTADTGSVHKELPPPPSYDSVTHVTHGHGADEVMPPPPSYDSVVTGERGMPPPPSYKSVVAAQGVQPPPSYDEMMTQSVQTTPPPPAYEAVVAAENEQQAGEQSPGAADVCCQGVPLYLDPAQCMDEQLCVEVRPRPLHPQTVRAMAQPKILVGGCKSLFAMPGLTSAGQAMLQWHVAGDHIALPQGGVQATTEDIDAAPCAAVPAYESGMAVTTHVLMDEVSGTMWTGHEDGRVCRWSITPAGHAARCEQCFRAHTNSKVRGMALSCWGDLWTGSSAGTLRVWAHPNGVLGVSAPPELTDLKRPGARRPHSKVLAVACSSSGRTMWSIGTTLAIIWDAYSGEYKGTLQLDAQFEGGGNAGTAAQQGDEDVWVDPAKGLDSHAMRGEFKVRGAAPAHEMASSSAAAAGAGTQGKEGTSQGWKGMAAVSKFAVKLGKKINKTATTVSKNIQERAAKFEQGGAGGDDTGQVNDAGRERERADKRAKLQALMASLDDAMLLVFKSGHVDKYTELGKLLWSVELRVRVKCALLVERGVWVGAEDGCLRVLDIATGDVLACWPAHLARIKSLAVVEGVVYSLALDGSIKGWPVTQPPHPLAVDAWKDVLRQGLRPHKLRVLAGTWNVATRKAQPRSVVEWLANAADAHIVCVGLQEVEMGMGSVAQDAARTMLNKAALERGNTLAQWWADTILGAIGGSDEFARVALRQMSGILVLLYVRKKLLAHVGEVVTGHVACGVMGVAGNKGATAVCVTLFRRRLVFLASHFAAHQEKVEERNADYAKIVRNLTFFELTPPAASNSTATPARHLSQASQSGDSAAAAVAAAAAAATPLPANEAIGFALQQAEAIIWMGDFNYRIKAPYQWVIDRAVAGSIKQMIMMDQAREEMEKGHVFHALSEGPLTFPPTYKFDDLQRNEDGTLKLTFEDGSRIPRYQGKGVLMPYDHSERQRIPAWTDRILFRGSLPLKGHTHANRPEDLQVALAQHTDGRPAYSCNLEVFDSDHKPVTADLDVLIPEHDAHYKRNMTMQVISKVVRMVLPAEPAHAVLQLSANALPYQVQGAIPEVQLKPNTHDTIRIVNTSPNTLLMFTIGGAGKDAHESSSRGSDDADVAWRLPAWLDVLPCNAVLAPGAAIIVKLQGPSVTSLDPRSSSPLISRHEVLLRVYVQHLLASGGGQLNPAAAAAAAAAAATQQGVQPLVLRVTYNPF